MQTVLIAGDLHLPFHDMGCLERFYLAVEEHKPTVIVQIGDLYDMYSHSKFPRSLDLMTPKQEVCEARQGAEAFWKNVKQKASKKCRLLQILGNHDERPSKRIAEKYGEIASLVGIDDLFKFPGVETSLDARAEVKIDDVIYTHGHFTGITGKHAAFYSQSVVHGHSHRGGVVYHKLHGRVIWELDVGHMADEGCEPLQYTPTKTTKWTQGYGLVDQFGPRFIPI